MCGTPGLGQNKSWVRFNLPSQGTGRGLSLSSTSVPGTKTKILLATVEILVRFGNLKPGRGTKQPAATFWGLDETQDSNTHTHARVVGILSA